MLLNINPLLTGDLLRILDHMGHGDQLVISDANFPAYSLGLPALDVQASSPALLQAVRTVLPVDTYEGPAVLLMRAEPGLGVDVQRELRAAADCPDDRIDALDRHDFYAAARGAVAVVRSSEARPYGNVLVRKGVVPPTGADA